MSCTLPPCGPPRTPVYYHDKTCVIMDCETCTQQSGHPVPMVVLARHDPRGTEEERTYMRRMLKRMFPARTIDETMRSMPDHAHMHARRKG